MPCMWVLRFFTVSRYVLAARRVGFKAFFEFLLLCMWVLMFFTLLRYVFCARRVGFKVLGAFFHDLHVGFKVF